MAKKSKRRGSMNEGLSSGQQYGLSEAIKLVKERATSKFDETMMSIDGDSDACRVSLS